MARSFNDNGAIHAGVATDRTVKNIDAGNRAYDGFRRVVWGNR